MRKTQVALAALALVASTAAMADVNVYGNLEAAVVSGNKNSGTRFAGAGEWGASAIGFKGSEDLGSGMKANFNLEGGLDTNYGGNNNGGTAGIFNRAANVGLSTGFGNITAGVQISPFILSYVTTLGLAGNNFVVPTLANAGALDASTAAGTASTTGGFFISNAVSYSNNFGPISASVIGATRNGTENNGYGGGNISFTQDNLYLTAAIAERDSTANGYKNWVVGGTYTLGDIKLAANYISADPKALANDSRKTTTVGASYALGATTIGLNYSRTSVENSANDPTLTNLSVSHALSKRTSAYAFYNNGTDGSGVSYQGTVTPATNAIGVGVAHAF